MPGGECAAQFEGFPVFGCADEVDGEMPDDGHVPGAVPLAEAGLVFLEDGVEDPVEAVFDAPVSAHGACGVFGGEACGGDVVAGIEAAAVDRKSTSLNSSQ